MKTHKRPAFAVSYCMILCLHAVEGAEIPKLFNTTPLNQAGSWSGGVVPGPGDVALWNSLFPSPVTASGALSPLGANLSVSGIKVTNVGGTRNAGSSFVGYTDAAPAKTLTIGAAGIDMSAATQAFLSFSRIAIGADQSWLIADANTNGSPAGLNNNEDLAFIARAAGDPFDFGGKKVTVTGGGYVTISSGYTLKNGTLDTGNTLFVIQGGSNQTTNLNADLNLVVSAGRLRFQANSGSGGASLVSAAPVTVNGGALELRGNTAGLSLSQSGKITLKNGTTLTSIATASSPQTVSGPIEVGGAVSWGVNGGGAIVDGIRLLGNLSGAGAIDYQNIATGTATQFVLSGDNSGFAGSLTLDGPSGNRSLRLASATAGSAAAAWNVGTDNTLQVNGVTVQLGSLNGAGFVTNSSTTAPATLQVSTGVFGGVISNGASQPSNLTKVGSGTFVLTGKSTYSGLTSVTAGKLVVPASQPTPLTNNFTVADGANLTVSIPEAESTLNASQIQLGDTTGATLGIDLGAGALPQTAPLYPSTLAINGASFLRISGTNLTTGSFPAVYYDSIGGSSGLGGLALKLPPRTLGSLTPSAGTLTVNIDQTEQIKWAGNVSNDWDIAPGGTLNWVPTVTGGSTRYIEGPDGNDVVNFDDSAPGSGTVVLTTALAPAGLRVNNPTKAYTFTGPGKITGSTGLVKSGAGTLTLANATPNDYLGGTTISAGTLRLGDGATAGAGVISGPITNEGRLILNRPDDFAFTTPFSGAGILEKAASNTVTLGNLALTNPVVLTAGKLLFTSGATLSGTISGPGQMENSAGTLLIQGTDPNTQTGLTTLSGGNLRLNKPAGVQAIGGDITITGSGSMAILADEQIADTATLNIFGSSTDSLVNTTGKETIANANVNGTSAATQLVLRAGAEVTGTATVTQGILGVASSNTATLHRVVMTSPAALLRVAGAGGPSFMNIGSGGLTASGGEIQVKFNTADQDATLNLGGDFTATGDVKITNAGYTGAFLNVINLEAARTFDIAAGTVTTVAPDLSGAGSLVKTGSGTLTLNASSSAAQSGGSQVSAGTLIVNGSHAGAIAVDPAGTLAGGGSVAGAVSVSGAAAPGDGVGKLTATGPVTLAAGSSLAIQIGNWAGVTAGVDWDLLAADTLTLAATPGSKLAIRVSGSPTGFAETAKTLTIATSANPLAGFDPAAIAIDSSGFSGSGTFAIQKTGETLELVYSAGAGTPYSNWATAKGLDGANDAPGIDADSDGLVNLVEYALGLNPLKSSLPPGTFDGATVTFTKGAEALAGSDVNYIIETSTDLGLTDPWTAAVSQNAPNASATISYTLPATGPKRFARLKIVQVP